MSQSFGRDIDSTCMVFPPLIGLFPALPSIHVWPIHEPLSWPIKGFGDSVDGGYELVVAGLLNLWKAIVWQVLKIQYVPQNLLEHTQIYSSTQNGWRSEAISALHITLMGGGLHRLSGAACCGFPRRQQAYKSGKWRWWDTVPSASFSCHSL